MSKFKKVLWFILGFIFGACIPFVCTLFLTITMTSRYLPRSPSSLHRLLIDVLFAAAITAIIFACIFWRKNKSLVIGFFIASLFLAARGAILSQKTVNKKPQESSPLIPLSRNGKLQGIMYSKDNPIAIIDGENYGINGTVYGHKIVNISPRSITIQFQDGKRDFEIDETIPKK